MNRIVAIEYLKTYFVTLFLVGHTFPTHERVPELLFQTWTKVLALYGPYSRTLFSAKHCFNLRFCPGAVYLRIHKHCLNLCLEITV